MNIRCIIVDDEALAREGLEAILSEKKDMEILRSCEDGLSAITAIEDLKPDLVFLDVQMPGVNGFEVVASLTRPRPYVIFVTAHDQYAIKAFEISAVDYLLKPFSDSRFDTALKKATDLLQKDRLSENYAMDTLISHTRKSAKGNTQLLTGTLQDNTLVFKADGQVHKVGYSAISHIEAYDYYIKIHIANDLFLIRETMKNMTDQLPADRFVRIHKSHIVNLDYVRQYGKGADDYHQVTLTDGQTLRVSRSYKNNLKDKF
ncbi:MAG: LytTR family DNA-binding domain-containing protein [Cyclobacteriaceae bacterium]